MPRVATKASQRSFFVTHPGKKMKKGNRLSQASHVASFLPLSEHILKPRRFMPYRVCHSRKWMLASCLAL